MLNDFCTNVLYCFSEGVYSLVTAKLFPNIISVNLQLLLYLRHGA